MGTEKQEIPRYRLTEKCYLNEVLYDPEAMPIDPSTGESKPVFINWDKKPEYYMEPANDAARARFKEAKIGAYENPIDRITNATVPAVQVG